MLLLNLGFFFFQAEDGIRDIGVTGVQTCALPIWPSDDRPWLTYDPKGNHIYLTYHEFVSAQPIAFRSDNGGGDDFVNPCGPLVTDPTIEANIPQDVTGGTLVARPVVDKNGTLYVLFATTTQQENAAAAA